MANYYGSCRSSYFKVKNEAAFDKFCTKWGLTKFKQKDLVGFGVIDDGSGGLPAGYMTEEDFVEADLLSELSKLLHPEHLAIVQESGAEKLRYIVGYAWLVKPDGKVTFLNISDIANQRARRSNLKYTKAEF